MIEAATGITLKVGGNFITIDPSGVAIKGVLIQLNSGGAALSGSPGTLVPPLSPTAAQEAVQADPGAMAAAPSGSPGSIASMGALNTSPASRSPAHNPNSPENQNKKHWIEIELVDEEGKPVAGEAYRITSSRWHDRGGGDS